MTDPPPDNPPSTPDPGDPPTGTLPDEPLPDPPADNPPIGDPLILATAPHMTATYGEQIAVPVQVSETTAANIVSAEVFLAYDGNLLTALSVDAINTLLVGDWSVERNIVDGNGTPMDTVKIAMATDNDALTGSGVLIYVDFTVADLRAPASSPLTLTHVLFNDGTPNEAVLDGSVTLIGVDGTIVNDPAEIIPRENIFITVTDADENRDADNPDHFDLRVATGAQTETLTLTETGDATGIFEGTLATVFSLGATSGDHRVQAKAGDTIETCYDDWLDATGITVERCASTTVLGGTDGTIRTTIVSQPGDTVRVRVTDADLNTDPGLQETADVTAVNNQTGETGTISLTEDGNDSDIFFGLLFTTPGANAGPSGDATFNTKKGDILDLTYVDVVTELGGTEDLVDDDDVVDPFGDADANGSVQAFDAAKVLYHCLVPYLTGLDSLSANLDLRAFNPPNNPPGAPLPVGQITPFDASLILQKRVGLIDRFPVQEDEADNHPQPQTDQSTPKPVPDERTFALRVHDGYLSVWVDERAGIVSGDLLIDGVSGPVTLADDLSDFLSASQSTHNGVRIVFAGASPADGPGELLRVYRVGSDVAQLTRISINDGSITARVDATVQTASLPARFALHPNVPNPFNPQTTLRFDLTEDSHVLLEIFDVLGQRVRVLVDGREGVGTHQVIWDGQNDAGVPVGSGVYFGRLQTRGHMAIRRMLRNITVDGNLSDWPADLRWYPISVTGAGMKPGNPEDFTGRFRVGYNFDENALYVAVEARDESTVINPRRGPDWYTQDGCEVFVDLQHGEPASPFAKYAIYGDYRRANLSWQGESVLDARKEVRLAVERRAGVHQYEWRIDIGSLSAGETQLRAGLGTQKGLWWTLGIPDGLSSSKVVTMLQDRRGFLWFGVENGGLWRYDGEEFLVYTTAEGLAHDWVVSLFEDRRGNLWFGTHGGGVCRYDAGTPVCDSPTSPPGKACPGTKSSLSTRTGTETCGSGPIKGWGATTAGASRP